jgi:hypothetical protein
MARLPAGTYRIKASGFDESFEKTVEVPTSRLHTVLFTEWTKCEVADDTPGPGY